MSVSQPTPSRSQSTLYTPAERARRDATVWTLVQGILAPLQFLAFAVSLCLVVNFLLNGVGFEAATFSVIVKTSLLYGIMVTGAIWEKVVFGRYLFAPAFFWEDVVSLLVMGLHTAYVVMWLMGWGTPAEQMWIALAAYSTYVVNALQFLLKFQAARQTVPIDTTPAVAVMSLQGALDS
jgi:3-vinyl bacteriochlorophyllide hydratase